MGTICPPNYAILFMDYLEQQFLQREILKPLVWWHYIDDVFLIWTFSSEELETFMGSLNRFHPTIKFTHEIDSHRINFLDPTVIKEEDGTLRTTLFTKPTDTHLYLHYTSGHPKHQIKNIPFGQFLRVRRICTAKEDFEKQGKLIYKDFRDRGYPSALLDAAFQKAKEREREDLLAETTKFKRTIVPFITQFDPRLVNVKYILRDHEGILYRNRDKLPNQNSHLTMRTYKRPKSLRDILVRADVKLSTSTRGSQVCQKPCRLCPFMPTCKEVTSHSNGKKITILCSINCNTTSVMYLVQCRKCGIQYIGQTSNSIRERFNGHFADIRQNNQYKPVSRHFTAAAHNLQDISIIGLTTTETNLNTRLRTEEAYIAAMETTQPSGLNIRSRVENSHGQQ